MWLASPVRVIVGRLPPRTPGPRRAPGYGGHSQHRDRENGPGEERPFIRHLVRPACPRPRIHIPPPCARPHELRCALHSSQHLGIVGDKALARIKYMGLCRNKLSALPPKISIMVSLVEVRCTDNWLKNLPEVRRLSVCSCVSAVHSVKALGPWLAPLLRRA